MSGDIIKSLNKINISVNENDQILWESQAAAKCNNEAIEKLKEECERLNKEIAKTAKEICEIGPQIKILESNYDVQNESLALNQQTLINQRVHKKCLAERIKKHEQEADRLIDEYAQYIKTCKDELELTNPTYKILQMKKIELKQRKIYCNDLQQRVMELKCINKQKIKIKYQLFCNDIIEFARNWIDDKKYLKIMDRLKEETRKERELIKKLAEVTEVLKQKQTGRFLRNQASGFNIPHIEFSTNIVEKSEEKTAVKAKTQMNNSLETIKTMLDKKDEDSTINSKISDDQKLKYNINNSKVRILENRTLRQAQDVATPCSFKSKEERSKEIAEKIQKVVQNFNKCISRQNSKKSAPSSQKCSKVDKNGDKLKENLSRQLSEDQEFKMLEMSQSSQKDPHDGSSAPRAVQNLNVTGAISRKIETNTFNLGSSGDCLQFSNKHLSYFNTENDIFKGGPSIQRNPNENYNNNSFAQNANFLSQALANINKTTEPTENATTSINRSSQFCGNSNNKVQSTNSKEKSTFALSTNSEYNTGLSSTRNTSHATFLGSYLDNIDMNTKNETSQQNNNFLMNITGTDDYKSPQFSPNYCSPPTEENNANVGTNLFSFGQFNSSLFNLKLN